MVCKFLIHQFFFQKKLNIFLLAFAVSSCLNFSGDSPNQKAPKTKASSNSIDAKEILKTFKGGTLDLRRSGILRISGTNDQKKLLETQITLYGDGKIILSSDKALSFFGHGKKFVLGSREFNHFVIEEYRLGKSIKSTIKHSKDGLNYRLKL
ncbi:MAG: hypothetical protein CME61_04500 [Halobacteriovoraceae bacterium]|nr:hypothetical protein [Halobacteriovoraceae bacterium]